MILLKSKMFLISIIVISIVNACQSSAETPAATATPPGQMETQVAATIYAGQTSTIVAEQAFHATLTAVFPTLTDTPVPTPTPNVFMVNIPASACWMNSEVEVRMGQIVLITASGTVNTWGGRAGSSSGPDGQAGICGAVQCPKQGVGYGALIGRLEDLPTFFVGNKYEFVATMDGQLYFTVNDWECNDNSGEYRVVVTMR